MKYVGIDEPNEKQRQFFLSRATYTCYGGARGGGKSWALRKKAAMLGARYKGIKMLLIRRSFSELNENHIIPLKSELFGIASWLERDKCFTFTNGSRLKMGYCEHESDVDQYQGQEYDVIFIDEATHLTENQFVALTACLRGTGDYPRRMYLTCNPGNVGHAWVKRLFIDRKYRETENQDDYVFIPATVYDNKALMEKDPDYEKRLKNIADDKLREAWLNGNWEMFVGQYFTEWDKNRHVIEPFPIPAGWRRYFAMDYGLDMLAGYWIAMDEGGRAYVYREVYKSGLTIRQAAEAIKELTTEPMYEYIAPPDMWNRRQDTGQSAAELFFDEGLMFAKADNRRVQGWYSVKKWLADDGGTPKLVFFKNCTNVIEYFPLLQYDDNDPNDVSKTPHYMTHGPDAIRYFLSGRPIAAQAVKEEGDREDDYDTQVESLCDFGRCG